MRASVVRTRFHERPTRRCGRTSHPLDLAGGPLLIKTILVPLDGSSFGEHALRWAVSLARHMGSGLDLVTVAELPRTGNPPLGLDPAIVEADRARGIAEAQHYMAAVESAIRALGVPGEVTSAVLPPGNIVTSLVRRQTEVGAELTVMTSHGRGTIGRAWLGSVTDGFIRQSTRPVWVVRASEAAASGSAPEGLEGLLAELPELPKQVLLPLDGSPPSERLLELSAQVAHPTGEFLLLRVIPPILPGGSPYLPHVVRELETQEHIEAAAREDLQSIAGRIGRTRTEIRVVTDAHPGTTILEVAGTEGTELIAMATQGRGGAARLLLGSVADKVIRGAECPVLLFRNLD
jgi:nucleotide-binding universal stress UspA family protein